MGAGERVENCTANVVLTNVSDLIEHKKKERKKER
jgi:hypothetical protein